MSRKKLLQVVNDLKNANSKEIREEIFKRKRDLLNIRIHGTLKKDSDHLLKKRQLKKECQKIKAVLATTFSNSKKQKAIESDGKKIDRKGE